MCELALILSQFGVRVHLVTVVYSLCADLSPTLRVRKISPLLYDQQFDTT